MLRRNDPGFIAGFPEWILESGYPLLVLAARADHFKKQGLEKALKEIKAAHRLPQAPLPVSAHKKTGLEEVWKELTPMLVVG